MASPTEKVTGRHLGGEVKHPSASGNRDIKSSNRTTRAKGKAAVKGWEEKPYDVLEGEKKLTHSNVTQDYSGDIEGTGKVAYLMMYREDGSASFVGLHRVIGRLGGRAGSLVLQETGTFVKDKGAKGSWFIVPGSGTGELRGIRGQGETASKAGEHHATFTLEYDFG